MRKINNFKSQKDANNTLIGKKLKVIGNTASHGQPIGAIITVAGIQYPTTNNPVFTAVCNGTVRHFNYADVEAFSLTIDDLQEDITRLCKEIEESKKEQEMIAAKIKFMHSNGLEEYDENTFKAFHTLELLDNKKLSKIEKAKLISKLISE